MSAPQSIQELVLKSNQLGVRCPHNIQGSMLGFIGQNALSFLLRFKCSMPLGISKTTKAYLLAWKYTLSYLTSRKN